MKGILTLLLSLLVAASLAACSQNSPQTEQESAPVESDPVVSETSSTTPPAALEAPEGFVLIEGGSFLMGSPDSEPWRSEDETRHTVMVSDFYISPYELTQAEYEAVMGENSSSFSGEDLPVENISWLDAVAYCNARSEQEGLTPVYTIEGQNVTWNREADGYRLPTENSPSAEEVNYYGHYPYEIEGNYFSQGNLETQPGEYRQTTVAVGSFEPNGFGLYDMHGNVSEWVWDYYGAYPAEEQTDPTGPETGSLRVYRGGGWNDFAKNMRSAYRATLEPDLASFNIGIRLVRNAVAGSGTVSGGAIEKTADGDGNILIAFFSWGGNTRGIAEEIQRQTGADLFEITLVNPYSNDYNTVLDEAQRDQNEQARPELAGHVENMEQYDTILLGYPKMEQDYNCV